MKRYTINKLKRFLAELESHGIAYVSWKNNHQLQSALSGKENLDILFKNKKSYKYSVRVLYSLYAINRIIENLYNLSWFKDEKIKIKITPIIT